MARGRDGLHRRERGIFAFSYKDAKGVWREKIYGPPLIVRRQKTFGTAFLDDLKKGIRAHRRKKANWDTRGSGKEVVGLIS